MNKGKPASVEVRLPSRLGYEKVAMSTAAAVAKLMGFKEERVEDLKTAVAEACINAIEHGNLLNEGLSVGVVLSTADDALEVKVIDDGKGLKKMPTKPDIDRKIHGEEDRRSRVGEGRKRKKQLRTAGDTPRQGLRLRIRTNRFGRTRSCRLIRKRVLT